MSSQSSRGSEVSDLENDGFQPETASTPRPNKRLRMSTTDDGDDANENDHAVLPDSYLRSPRTSTKPQHQPGSILRVKLTNFVTYEHAEFHPGPNLNMVIGPNGTGKSTLVCAICIGLGWPTKHLGRAKDVADFVKHGHTKAVIEIELQQDPLKHQGNPIITATIKKQGNSCDFFTNGKKSSMRDVQKLVKSLSIQVDNLCQFLPQDRVVEFATLTPVALLAETQRAAAPAEVTEWHKELISLGQEAKSKDDEQDILQETLKRLEGRQRAQQADVDRVREHASLQKRLTILHRAKPFPLYKIKRQEFKAAKKAERQSDRVLQRVRAELEPGKLAEDNKAKHLAVIIDAITSKRKLRTRLENTANEIKEKFESKARLVDLKATALEREKDEVKASHQACQRLKQDIRKLQEAMLNKPPAVDLAAMNVEIREYSRQIRDAEVKENSVQDSMQEKRLQVRQWEDRIKFEEQKQTRMESQIGRQATRLEKVSKDSAQALRWLEQNTGLFEGEIFLPPMLTCEVTDPQCVSLLEAAVGRNGLIAFTATSTADHDKFVDLVRTGQRLTDVWTRIVEPGTVKPPPLCGKDQLRQYGLEGFLVDVIKGPETVVTMLCDNNGLDTTAYSTRQLSGSQNQQLRDSPISQWVTPKELSTVLRRREYGDSAVSIRVQQVRQPEFFTNAPVNNDAIRESRTAMLEMTDELAVLKRTHRELEEEAKQSQDNIKELKRKQTELISEKSEKQRLLTQFEALPTKIEGKQADLLTAERKTETYAEYRTAHDQAVDKLYLERGQVSIDLASNSEQTRKLHEEILLLELMEIEAESDHYQLKERNADAREQMQHHEAELRRLALLKEERRKEAEALQTQCIEASNESEQDEEAEFQELFGEATRMSVDELDNEIQSATARLEANTGGNANIIVEFEKRATDIEKKGRQMASLTSAREELNAKISEIRSKWEPALEDIISKISASFAENFASIQCAGEVELFRDDDFEQWAIHIKVKFRESEPMSILDSHRQSGGERAVSTIFYLMAMQSLARAPFRVVDEINQGMDPRNERLVHSRLVQIACESSRAGGGGGSQYFLITPKLLSGLDYHPNMKVHCIASGEHMPGMHSSLEFGQLAQRALAVRAM